MDDKAPWARMLLLTTDDPAAPGGGRAMLSRLAAGLLEEIHGPDFTILRLPARASTAMLDGVRGRLNGLDAGMLDRLCLQIAAEAITRVFIDGSNLGAAAREIKRRCPGVRVVTLFHNCETTFFAEAFRASPGVKPLAVLAGHWRAERMAVAASDCVIALCRRDSDNLERRFGRGADAILPMALVDSHDPAAAPVRARGRYALFVGGGFYGNIEGLRWYAREIAPRLGLRTLVIGRGLGAPLADLADNPHVELIGEVDALAPYYAGAAVVVAPIRSGSGMKTKVAEALMHGKIVVGTSEAFAGYGPEVLAANRCRDEAEGFARAVQAVAAADPPRFDPAQRALYERFHSPEAARARLASIIV
jgi:glycosyltransferase involved in cell wall biosynthesis